jgi:methylenetetrahydrofolate--tRNA-(uracil-5-)-methyltransferase
MAGRFAADLALGRPLRGLPRDTALGSLCHYISAADPVDYQPANITFDLLPPLDEPTRQKLRRDKRARHSEICRRAIESMERYLDV